MTTNKHLLALAIAIPATLLAACDNSTPAGPTDGGRRDSGSTDGGGGTDGGPVDGGGGTATCAMYCSTVMMNCTGDNAQYASAAECMSYCTAAGWPAGMDGATSGNSIACRIYHGGTPAMGEPATHCPHAGPTGGATCGTVGFNAAPAAMFTRVDRMGMPAVSTALIPGPHKNAYNDDTPMGESGGSYAADIVGTLVFLHGALDDDLRGLGLTPCTVDATGAGTCVPQGAPLVIPDTLHIDTSAAAGFPNGRRLDDQVIDVTLAVLLLDLSVHAPNTLAGVPVNPRANDVAEGVFLTAFPYLHPPHAP